jgi:hypothetical protein
MVQQLEQRAAWDEPHSAKLDASNLDTCESREGGDHTFCLTVMARPAV